MIKDDSTLTTNCGECGVEPGEFCHANCGIGIAGGYRKSDQNKDNRLKGD